MRIRTSARFAIPNIPIANCFGFVGSFLFVIMENHIEWCIQHFQQGKSSKDRASHHRKRIVAVQLFTHMAVCVRVCVGGGGDVERIPRIQTHTIAQILC